MARRVAPKKRLPRESAWPEPIEQTIEEVIAERARQFGFRRVPVTNVEPACREPSRWDIPQTLPGTGMFSAYEELDGSVAIVKLLRATPWLYRPLRDAVHALADRPGKSGPKRIEGCVACAFVGFVDSGMADVKPWYGSVGPDFWQACGLARIPSYKTIQRWFTELETISHVFADALHRLVQHARKHDPRIGQAVAVDATMAESNARPHKLADPTKLPKRIGKLPVIAAARMPTETVDDIRRASNAAPPDAGPLRVGEFVDVTPMVSTSRAGPFAIVQVKSGIYISRDPDAAFKAYTHDGKTIKWWHGYLLSQGIDHYTGLPLEGHGFAANRNEHTEFEPVVEKAIATLGHTPFFITADKGMSYRDCFEWCCERGITLVAPYRPANHHMPDKAQPTVHFDEHGIPYCRTPGCGAGTDQVGFVLRPAKGKKDRPRPILRVRCAAPQSQACLEVQEWDCHRDPARLLPVWRTHPAYSAARRRHMALERGHHEARMRANAKARHFETRSKRVSLTLTIMRMNVYALVAWLRACVINGWLGTPVLNPELERSAAQQRRLDAETQAGYINRAVIVARLRRGRVGGGRVPHRTRGAPTRRPEPATS